MRHERKTDGATLLEAAIALPIMLLMLGFIIDASLYLEAWSRVTDVSSRLARDIATGVPAQRLNPQSTATPTKCDALKSMADTVRDNIMRTRTPKHSATDPLNGVTVRVEKVEAKVGFPVTTIYAETPFNCVFCSFFELLTGEQAKVKTVSRQPVEIRSGPCVTPPA